MLELHEILSCSSDLLCVHGDIRDGDVEARCCADGADTHCDRSKWSDDNRHLPPENCFVLDFASLSLFFAGKNKNASREHCCQPFAGGPKCDFMAWKLKNYYQIYGFAPIISRFKKKPA